MKTSKTNDKKYPIKMTLSNGTIIKVPKQANFDNSFLRCHGCSIMAEYLALQLLHKHIWPINLLKWHRANDKANVKAKVTLRGVNKGINHYKKGHAKYDANPNPNKVNLALRNGYAVILEQKNPIHSVFLFRDGDDYMVSYGKVTRVNATKIAQKLTTNATYRGMVMVK